MDGLWLDLAQFMLVDPGNVQFVVEYTLRVTLSGEGGALGFSYSSHQSEVRQFLNLKLEADRKC